MSDATTPWLLRVLRAFRDEMQAAHPSGNPKVLIGWPHPAMKEGRIAAFVWPAADPMQIIDGRVRHSGAEIVTGILYRADPTDRGEREIEQAIAAYSAMQTQLVLAADEQDSAFNSAFEGVAFPAEDKGGIQPTGANDFDGHCIIGERWTVTGSSASVGAANA